MQSGERQDPGSTDFVSSLIKDIKKIFEGRPGITLSLYIGGNYPGRWLTYCGGYTYKTKNRDHIFSFQFIDCLIFKEDLKRIEAKINTEVLSGSAKEYYNRVFTFDLSTCISKKVIA